MRITIFCLGLLLGVASAWGATPDQMLMEAIRDSNLAGIDNAIASGARVNSNGANLDPALPPLIYALLFNDPATVGKLLARGADSNLNQRGHDPMYYATNGDTRILKLMLEAKGNPNTHTSPLGYTPLHSVAICRPQTYASLLNSGGYKGTPPDCNESLRLLVSAGAEVNAQDSGGKTPLYYAIEFNNVEAARQLLIAGTNPDSIDREGSAALIEALSHYAIEMDNRRLNRDPVFGSTLPMVELLLEFHANPNVVADGSYDEYNDGRMTPYSSGYTPLTMAARHGWFQVVKLLLRYNADSTMPRSDGVTALAIAELYGHFKTAALIRKQGESANKSPQEDAPKVVRP